MFRKIYDVIFLSKKNEAQSYYTRYVCIPLEKLCCSCDIVQDNACTLNPNDIVLMEATWMTFYRGVPERDNDGA